MFNLYSETWVFDQSERAQGPIYIVNIYVCIQTRKSKVDQTVKRIYIYYFVQYFERNCLSSSGRYKL